MENNPKALSGAERLAIETGRPVLSTSTVEVLAGEVEQDETTLAAAIRTGVAVMTKTTTVVEQER